MPIKRLQNQDAAFPRIGILRKGAPKPNEKRPGADLKYFRFDSLDEKATANFLAAYGPEPDSINVYLPFETVDENFQAWQEEYRAGGLVHRCDGETMTVHLVIGGQYSTEPAPCPYFSGEQKRTTNEPGCKPVGRLSVIIPELKRFAYVTVGTTSINDIMELTANLSAAYAMRGNLQSLPFILTRRPEKISTPDGKGGRARYEKWMLHIEPDPQWVAVQLETMRTQAMLPAGTRLLADSRMVTQDGEILDDEGEYTETYADPVIVQPAPAQAAKSQPEKAGPDIGDGDNGLQHQGQVGPDSLDEVEAISQNGDDFESIPQHKKATKLPDGLRKKLHAIGSQLYGEEWDTRRPELVKVVTTGKATSSNDLSVEEAEQLIRGMERKLSVQAAA